MSSAVISALLANEKRNFLVKAVDEKVKKLVLVDLTVCLFGFRHLQQADVLTKRLCEVLRVRCDRLLEIVFQFPDADVGAR